MHIFKNLIFRRLQQTSPEDAINSEERYEVVGGVESAPTNDDELPLLSRHRRYANQEFSHARQLLHERLALSQWAHALEKMRTPK